VFRVVSHNCCVVFRNTKPTTLFVVNIKEYYWLVHQPITPVPSLLYGLGLFHHLSQYVYPSALSADLDF